MTSMSEPIGQSTTLRSSTTDNGSLVGHAPVQSTSSALSAAGVFVIEATLTVLQFHDRSGFSFKPSVHPDVIEHPLANRWEAQDEMVRHTGLADHALRAEVGAC